MEILKLQDETKSSGSLKRLFFRFLFYYCLYVFGFFSSSFLLSIVLHQLIFFFEFVVFLARGHEVSALKVTQGGVCACPFVDHRFRVRGERKEQPSAIMRRWLPHRSRQLHDQCNTTSRFEELSNTAAL